MSFAHHASKKMPKFGLCIDWETSGATWGEMEYARDWQGVSYGAVIFDFATLSPIETLYREVKFTPKGPRGDKKWGWSQEAQNIHGLSKEYLGVSGISQQEAAMDLAQLLLDTFGPNPYIPLLGHNKDFDVAFTRQLLDSIDLKLNLFHVNLDTSGLGLLTLGIHRSNDLFEFLGLPERKDHNALEDALYTLESAKRIRGLVNAGLGY